MAVSTPSPKITTAKEAILIDKLSIAQLDVAGKSVFLQGFMKARKLAQARLKDVTDRLGEGAFSTENARAVLFQIEKSIKQMEKALSAGTGQAVNKASTMGIQAIAAQLGGLNKIYSGVTTPLAINQAKVFWGLQQSVAQSRMRQYQASINRYGMPLIKRYEQYLGEAITAKIPTYQIRENLIQMFNARTADEIPHLPGTTATPAPLLPWQAQRIVRTETMAAYNGAKWAGMRHELKTDFPDLKKKILAVMDDRTEADSLGVHEQVREIEEEFQDGAGRLYLYPPARPNDRESVIPWRDEWADEGAADDIDEALPATKEDLEEQRREERQEQKEEAQKAAEKAEKAEKAKILKPAFSENGKDYALNKLKPAFDPLPDAKDADALKFFSVDQKVKLIQQGVELKKHVELGIQELPLSKIKAITAYIEKQTVEEMAKNFTQAKWADGPLPIVYKLPHGKYVLYDGNKRVNAALLAGKKTGSFKVVEFKKSKQTAVKAASREKSLEKLVSPPPSKKFVEPGTYEPVPPPAESYSYSYHAEETYYHEQGVKFTGNPRVLFEDKKVNALNWYTNNNYMDLNRNLRKGHELTRQQTTHAKLIDKSFLPLRKNILSYRGVKEDDWSKEIKNLKPGDSFTDKGFLSTSLSLDRAEAFTSVNGLVFEIEGTMGLPAMYVGTISSYGREVELLYGRNMEMIVLEKREGAALTYMRVRLVHKKLKK